MKNPDLRPCPKCGSTDIKAQTPVRVDAGAVDMNDPASMVKHWVKIKNSGQDWLEGPVYFMCWSCKHHGPSTDCSGRTSTDVGKDKEVYAEMKRLWNEQKLCKHEHNGGCGVGYVLGGCVGTDRCPVKDAGN